MEGSKSALAWLTPQFAVQLGTLIVAGLASYFLLKGDVRSLAERQEEMKLATTQTLSEIKGQLPNKEALELRLHALEEKVADLQAERKEVSKLDVNLRLLQDYVEGRMGSMPYRKDK